MGVGWPVVSGFGVGWSGPCQGFFFDDEIGVAVVLHGSEIFVAFSGVPPVFYAA